VVYFDRIEGRPDSAPSSSLVTQSDVPKTVNAARRHGFGAVLRRLCLESTSISSQKLDSPSCATAVFIGGNARFSLLTTRESNELLEEVRAGLKATGVKVDGYLNRTGVYFDWDTKEWVYDERICDPCK
jgi:hypothetical protein